MSNLFTLIAENIFVVIGFAIYGVLVYYMVSKVLHRYTGRKTQRRAAGHSAAANAQKSSSFLKEKSSDSKNDTSSRRDFAKNIPTANSYVHRNSQQG